MGATLKVGTARWLSAAGHPGYGRAFAQRVLAECQYQGMDPNDLRVVSTLAFYCRGR